MKDLQDALVNGTFEEAIEAVNSSVSVGYYDLLELTQKAGLDGKTTHKLVSAIQEATKKQLMAELKKQTENMLYWVERV